MDYAHSVLRVNRRQHPGLHAIDLVQRNPSQVHNAVKSRPLEALRQDPRGTNLGHGCPTAPSQEKFHQFDKIQAQLQSEFQNHREGQEEPSFCLFTGQIRRYQAVEWQDLLLVSGQPQAFPLAHTQSGGMQHLQENAQGTKQIHERRQKGSLCGRKQTQERHGSNLPVQ